MQVQWMTGTGSIATSEVLSTFEDDNVTYVVVRVGRMSYDAAPPYAVLTMDECTPVE